MLVPTANKCTPTPKHTRHENHIRPTQLAAVCNLVDEMQTCPTFFRYVFSCSTVLHGKQFSNCLTVLSINKGRCSPWAIQSFTRWRWTNITSEMKSFVASVLIVVCFSGLAVSWFFNTFQSRWSHLFVWFSQLKFFVYLQQEAQITTRKPCGCSCTAGTSPMSTMPPQPTSPGSTLAPTLGTNYCNISTCPAPTQNTLCKYTVNYTVYFYYK